MGYSSKRTQVFVMLNIVAGLVTGCGATTSNVVGTTGTSSALTTLPAAANTTTANTCSTGYVYSTTYGCLLQSNCATGYGMYNGSCVLLTGTNAGSGACPAGSVYSAQYGCLVQGNCPIGYGLDGTSCVSLSGTTGATTCQGSCNAGYVQTAYGCLQQYNCGNCYGYIEGGCIPALY
jgi:hypothetical protein